MARSKFYEKIHTAREEREVDAVYTIGLNTYFKDVPITHPFKCDSYLDTVTEKGKNLRLLVEYKYDENFKTKTGISKVLAQVVFYLKRFEQEGKPLPNVVLVGDINECFVLQTNALQPYLDFEDVDWSKAPSEAHALFPKLVVALANDDKINPYVYDIDENFSFQNVASSIIDQADNVQRFVRVTEHNIAVIYNHFCNRVVRDQKKILPNELVSIFIGTILHTDSFYQHPCNPNRLVTPSGNVDVNGSAFTAFISVFEREYTPDERRKFAEISDRLVEETKRRRSGEFYTPTPFVDYAHRMLAEELGEDWREKYVVWDCCWGTGNLTRDYRFKELYASTLEPSELAIGAPYNREAKKFVFDFLNDEIKDVFGLHVPEGLYGALVNDKPILFFINPPYGTASSGGANTDFKEGCAETNVHASMMQNKIGTCSQNLYAQFLYHIVEMKKTFNLTNVAIGLYSPTLYLSGPSWRVFREKFLSEFKFENAFTFQASYFADVADSWGIAFSVWKSGTTDNKVEFPHTLVKFEDNEIKAEGTKLLYNTEGLTPANNWINSNTKPPKDIEIITAKSALNISDKTKKVGSNLGYLINDANNIDASVKGAYFMTMPVSRHIATTEIQTDNYHKCATLFSARKLISKNWINSKDEYLAPNEEHPQWKEFIGDSLVYSLFHTSSNQSSLRNVEYKGKTWDIINEFFFMSRKEMMQLSEAHKLYDTYEEVRTDKERFVYQLLELVCGRGNDSFGSSLPEQTCNALPETLSPEALAVLEKAREITRLTFPFRQLFHDEHPEYQILNWDCGWYQIKALAKEYAKEDMKTFDILYKALADKMRPMVYEVGFLK